MNILSALLLGASLLAPTANAKATADDATTTQRIYLSGHGADDMRQWQFYCTGGANAGHWTTIGVPSCWELQGFGTYQYGMRFYGKPKPEGIADERGLYKTEFSLPADWAGRQIELVFEGVMTDCRATINGRKAGEPHQGGFYRFAYDVSDRVFFGAKANRLEVEVAKESADERVNLAERRADYWNFGGIFRPVYIVAKPAVAINRVAVDAQMTGRFRSVCYLNRAAGAATVRVDIADAKGKTVASASAPTRGSDHADLDFAVSKPLLWTAETPNLYTAHYCLLDSKGQTLHRHSEKFGFRTVEVRASDGVYVNGRKVMFRGVNRHSFRPESGRTLSPEKCVEDVLLIKGMNMNAVRLSHYPADPEFYAACDSLGLYVLDELLGWHWAQPTENGKKLVREMIYRDQNHPSVVFWDNGNEGGFNYDLEPEFRSADLQKRTVLYPWANRNGMETKHYRSYGETEEYLREKEVFMPTEFLHGLYDGGHGAGLYDYWELMRHAERCAGGFLWDLADEGVVRTDRGGLIDCVGNFGADGIVGPHFEREGSYYTIKQLWCPVQLALADPARTVLDVENRYDHRTLAGVTVRYEYLDFGSPSRPAERVLLAKSAAPEALAPHTAGQLTLAAPPAGATALRATAVDADGHDLFTWAWKLKDCKAEAANGAAQSAAHSSLLTLNSSLPTDTTLTVSAGGTAYTFSKTTGKLLSVNTGKATVSLAGPRFVACRRADRSFDQFYNHDDTEAFQHKTLYTPYADQGSFAGLTSRQEGDTAVVAATYAHGSLQRVEWKLLPTGGAEMSCTCLFNGVVDIMGLAFDYPEQKVKAKQWLGQGPYRVWQNRLHGPQYGLWQTDYNDPIPGESFVYPEFKGYFAGVDWMRLSTDEGTITIIPGCGAPYVGVYQPRDGRDGLLYSLPDTGLSLLKVIPAVRNKVNTTDLNGPSAQPYWASGYYTARATFLFQ